MAQVQATTGEQNAALTIAAQTYGIPVAVLKGVYAIETGSGKNVATSSAGAQGAFQFLPSTAKKYNYPETNTVDQVTFNQQALAAAHYLSDLFHQHGGNWDAALKAYSGGGYGFSKVQAASGGTISGIADIGSGPVVQTVKDTASAIGDVGSAVSKAVSFLTDPNTWLRIGEFILGVAALYLGLHALTGQSSSAGDQAKHVRTLFIPI